MIDRSLEKLEPETRAVALKWFHITSEIMGIDARVIETLRSHARQKDLKERGLSGNLVGWHCFGRAWDFGVFVSGDYQHDDRSGLYLKCGFIGMALGCRWGGNWDQDKNIGEGGENDLGHLEYRPGLTLTMMERMN